ncbi:MAG: hypothetical protein J7L15_09445 [Clostridiales bacterium]|nr:hypothetical protein [Clostridiales bacterium]
MKEIDLKDYDIAKDSCAECSSINLFMEVQPHKYQLGTGEYKLNMEVDIPVITCRDCGFCWMNYLAEDIITKVETPLREILYRDKKSC